MNKDLLDFVTTKRQEQRLLRKQLSQFSKLSIAEMMKKTPDILDVSEKLVSIHAEIRQKLSQEDAKMSDLVQ